MAPEAMAVDVAAKILTDVCDLEPDDPNDPDVVIVTVSALEIILRRHVEPLEAAQVRIAGLREIAIQFRTDATDTYFVECFRCADMSTGRYIKCDYHNMRDAEARFDTALAEWDAAADPAAQETSRE